MATATAATPELGSFERVEGLDLIRVPARALRVFAQTVPGGLRPVSVREARELLRGQHANPIALLNGSMFGVCGGGDDYAHARCEVIHYRTLDRNSGVDIPASAAHQTDGQTIAVVDGRLVAVTGGHPPDLATVAIQGWPALVRDGRSLVAALPPPVSEWSETTWRAGLAVFDPDWAAFWCVRDTMMGAAARLARAGAKAALYGDGGGSTTLVSRGGSFKGSAENRRVPTVWWASGDSGSGVIVRGPDGNPIVAGPPPIQASAGKLVAGAGVGAGIGFAVAGPPGAVIGGVFGFVAAAVSK